MDETRHTPGPWYVLADSLRIGRRSDYVPALVVVADCRVAVGASVAESQANARLIAAAPDLLAALEVIGIMGAHSDCAGCSDAAAIARAAIAKATGA